jgi:hypothetical protein
VKLFKDLRFKSYCCRVVTIVGMALSLTSCSTKAAECTKLTGMIQEGQTLIINLSPQLDVSSTQQLSQELNSIAREIETLNIKNQSLKTIQKNATQQFKDLSNNLKQLAEALTNAEKAPVNPEGKKQLLEAQKTAKEAGEKVKQIAPQNEKLLQDLVNYCPQKKT